MRAWRLAYLRFRRGVTSLGSAVFLVAAVQGALVLVYAVQPSIESQAVAERISALPLDSRWITVATSDSDVNARSAGAIARQVLSKISDMPVTAHLVFGPLSDGRAGRFQLLASDALRSELRLVSGRWPTRCVAAFCEVVVVGNDISTPLPGLRIVGHAAFTTGSALRLGLAADAPVLASSDPVGLLALPQYRAIPHALQWLTDIDTAYINRTGIAAYIDDVLQQANALSLRDARLHLSAPTTQLSASAAQVRALQQRTLGLAVCILLISLFAVHRIALAARREHRATVRRAREFAWSRNLRAQFALATGLFVIVPGMLLGMLVGGAASLAFFGVRAAPDPALWLWSGALGLSGLLAILAGLEMPTQWRIATLTLCFGAWAVTTRINGYDAEVLIISILGAVVASLVGHTIRPWRLTPFGRNLVRANLTRLSAVTVVAGFLAAFALGSIASLQMLQQGVEDSAVFVSPLNTRVSWGDRLPLQTHSLADFASMSGGHRVFAVHTARASIRENLMASTPVEVLGIARDAWVKMPDLEPQAGITNAAIAAALDTAQAQPGIRTSGASSLSGRAVGIDPNVLLSVWVLNRDGEAQQHALPIAQDGSFRLTLEPTTASLLGFALDESPQAAAHRAHAVGEGNNTLPAPHGTLRLDELQLDQAPVEPNGVLPEGGPLTASAQTLQWKYTLLGGSGWAPLVRMPQAIRAVVDPLTAALATDGVIPLRFSDDMVVPVHVTAVAERLPAVAPRFAVVDGGALVALLAAGAPSQLQVSEVWLTHSLSPAGLASVSRAGLTVTTRADAIALRAGSSASAWSSRTLELFVLLGVLLLITFIVLSMREVLAHAELEGWRGQGASRESMIRTARRIVLAAVAVAVLSAVLILSAVMPFVLGRTNTDITGTPAVPPLHANGSAFTLLLVTVGGLAVAAAAVLMRGQRRLGGVR